MYVDIVILLFLLIAIIRGYRKGFLKTLVYFLSWIAAIIGAVCISGMLKSYFLEVPFFSQWFDLLNVSYLPVALSNSITTTVAEICAGIVAFFLILIVLKIIINIILSLIKVLHKPYVLRRINRVLGAVAGLFKGAVLLWLASMFIIPFVAALNSAALAGIFDDSIILTVLYGNGLFIG